MRYLPFLLWFALLVYCLIDVAQADPARVRALPKGLWALLIVVLPFLGSIAWLLAGRPGTGPGGPRLPGARRRAPAAPDDDPAFLADLARANAQRERERRRREQQDHPPEAPSA